jgi:methionine-R-sulfoxide reductase
MFKSKTSTDDVTTYEVTKTDEDWRKELSPERYEVLRHAGTERAWSGELLHVDGEGVFRCAGCGAVLFDTDSKFDSGSGWPSFDRARSEGTIIERSDSSLFMRRVEILCARCGGHLGHVFPDGPTETGMRYCVNSLSLTYDQDEGGEVAPFEVGGLEKTADEADTAAES